MRHTKRVTAAVLLACAVQADATPLDNFVSLERLHGATLVATIDRTLGALARVLKGKVGGLLGAEPGPGWRSWHLVHML